MAGHIPARVAIAAVLAMAPTMAGAVGDLPITLDKAGAAGVYASVSPLLVGDYECPRDQTPVSGSINGGGLGTLDVQRIIIDFDKGAEIMIDRGADHVRHVTTVNITCRKNQQ